MTKFLFRWWWLVAVVVFVFCVALKLNGSSIGCWQEVLHESGPVPGLLFSTPKRVRADEWIVWTPSMLSQAKQTTPFPIENSSLGGRRAPLLMSVPVAYYTTWFRPQLWGFFFFDFERGFSFYWFTKVFGLLLAPAWLLWQMGVRHRGIIVFGAVWIFFSSFMQWWFSSPTMLPEMVTTWALCTGCAIAFFKQTNHWRLAGVFVGYIFFGINFLLCLYPPFQIPLFILGFAVLAGMWMEARVTDQPFQSWRGIILVLLSSATILLLLTRFWIDVRPTIQIVARTVYPGMRRSTGGDLSLLRLFSGLLGFFESEDRIPLGRSNICEASNFYPLWPMAVAAVAVARFRSRVAISPLIWVLGIFLIGLSLYCIVPLPEWLLRATFLAYAPERRTLLGIGLANIFLCCLFLDRYRDPIFGTRGAVMSALGFTLLIGIVFAVTGSRDPAFFSDRRYLAVLLIVNAAIIAMFFWERARRWLPALFAALLICGNAGINPLMRGLTPLLGSNVFREVDKIHAADRDGKWVVYYDLRLPQLVKATGASVLNGTKIVPDIPFLRQLDPDGAGASVYNRYAHIGCAVPSDPMQINFTLTHPDLYVISLSPALPPLRDAGYRYFVFPENWTEVALYGMSLVTSLPANHVWIYRPAE